MSTPCDVRYGARNRDPAIQSSDIVPRHVSLVPRDARVTNRILGAGILCENSVVALRSRIDRIHIVDRRWRAKSCGAGGFPSTTLSPHRNSSEVIFGACLMDGLLYARADIVISKRQDIWRFSAMKFSQCNSILSTFSLIEHARWSTDRPNPLNSRIRDLVLSFFFSCGVLMTAVR